MPPLRRFYNLNMKCDTRNVAGWVVIPILLLLSTASVHSRCSIFNVVSYIDTTKGMATCLNININNMKTSDFLSLSHGILPLDECVSNSQQNTCISQVTDFIEDDSNNAFFVNIGQKLLQNDALACSCITQFVPTLDGCVSVLDEYNLYCDAFVKSKPSKSQCSSLLLGACNSINMTNPSNTNFGDILTCLMDNMAELQSDCMQLMNSMLASSFIACSSDIATTCYDIRNGPVGILTCLVENLNTLQPSCRAEIESLAGDVVPCATESAKYCPDKGDPDDVLACLIEKEAAGKPISASCKGMLAAFQNCEESDDISDPWSFGSGTDDDAAEPKPKPKPGPGAGFGSDDGNSPPNSPGAGPGGDGGRGDDDWSTSKQKPKPGPGGDGPPGGGGGGPPNGGGSPNGPGGGSGGHGGHGGHGPPSNMRSLEQRRSQAFAGSDIDRIKAQLKAAWLPQQPTQNRHRRLQPGNGNPPGGPSGGGGGPPGAPSNDGTGGQGGGGGKTKPMPCWMPGGGGSGKKEGGRSWDDDNMAAGGRGPPGPGNGPGGAGAGEAAGGGQHGGHSGRSGTPAGDGLQGAAEDSLQPKRRMGLARIGTYGRAWFGDDGRGKLGSFSFCWLISKA